ncbi:hypothetical protein EPN90_04970 [Patescibacteria group bacterium]|nr:MAG: hypothetical protein EPN90_04970 [Patescibacteria group bacterium]
MKKLLSAVFAVNFAFFPVPGIAADNLPVAKNLVAEIPAPWSSNVPKPEDFKAFQCGERVYLVWQVQKENGYKGQKISKLFALKANGAKLTKYWQVMAEDSPSSLVRFTGTCVGERAVITNHWEDPLHQTGGDMATSVNGEETYGPLWKPDGRTIYHWYKSDGKDFAAINVAGGVLGPPRLHTLKIERGETYINGTIWKTANSVYGSSANFILAVDGRAYAQFAPWFQDLKAVNMSALALYEVSFNRVSGKWLISEQSTSQIGVKNTAGIYGRGDAENVWRVIGSGSPPYSWLDSSRRGQLMVKGDGLYFQKLIASESGTSPAYESAIRIHTAATNDSVNAPRVYGAPAEYGVGSSFAYGVRTGDGKIQVWRAVVK